MRIVIVEWTSSTYGDGEIIRNFSSWKEVTDEEYLALQNYITRYYPSWTIVIDRTDEINMDTILKEATAYQKKLEEDRIKHTKKKAADAERNKAQTLEKKKKLLAKLKQELKDEEDA